MDRVSSVRAEAAVSHTRHVRKPDFFIIGAPKAGTTSLYTYLTAHPDIYMPELKEPFFFCSDLPGYRERATLVDDESKYLKLFARATDEHLSLGEASSLYLFSKVAVPNIVNFQPDARFIVMLRNPVDLVHSFHSQLVFSLHESVADFEQAWRLQRARAQGTCIPKDCLESALLQYRQVALLGEQVARLWTHICRSRVKILLLDEFAADPQRHYEEVLAFLDVPSDQRTEFPKENANKARRSRLLTRLLRHPPFPLNVLRDEYIRQVGVSAWPIQVVAKLNRKPVVRERLSLALRRELEEEFHDDVRRLELLIDRDLSHWIPVRR